MDEKTKQMLIDAGMQAHIDIFEITKSGYAGVLPGTGMIVDRREHPEAIPVPRNDYFGIPEPKEIRKEENL